VFDAVVRERGDGLIVTIPEAEAERPGLRGGPVLAGAVRLDRRPAAPCPPRDLRAAPRDVPADAEFVAGLRWPEEQDAAPEGSGRDAPDGGAAPPPRPRPR
jgi:hypothetical protein